jgi:hypothetical protein
VAKHSKKEVTVKLELPPGIAIPPLYINRFYGRSDGPFLELCFGYEGKSRLPIEDIMIVIAKEDVALQKDSNEKYFAEVVTGEPIDGTAWRPSNCTRVYSANLMKMARRGVTAETTFIAFSSHDSHVREGFSEIVDGELKVPGNLILSMRSPLEIQLQLLQHLLF